MKKYLIFVLTVFILIATPLTVSATAEKGAEGTCNVTFFITDESGSYPGSSFTAIMTDETGTITDSYKFAKGGSWGGNNTPKYTVAAPVTYTVTFEGLENGYTIVNTLNYSSDISFAAASGGVTDVYWSIISTDTQSSTSIPTEGSRSILAEQSDRINATDSEAEEIYQSFLRAVSPAADNEEWYSALLIHYEWFGASTYAKWYADYVDGGTEDDFLSMSLFDRFVWSETYLSYANGLENYSWYYGSKENYDSHMTSSVVGMIENGPDYETVKDAYLALAEWQYNYVLANGYPYNFINGQTYLDEVGEVPETISTEEAEEQEQKELEEAAAELLEELDEEDIQELTEDSENSFFGSFGIIIAIVSILFAAVGAFVILRRRKTK